MGAGSFAPSQVSKTIVDFSKQPSVIRFAFSGGDPFVFLEEIIGAMSDARERGVRQPFHMVTSGYWANDLAHATHALTKLKNVGMDALDVSYDVEHARFVPASNICNIAKACSILNVKLDVFGNFWNEDERVEDLLPPLEGVNFHSALVMPIGAARQHFSGARYNLPASLKFSCGRARLYDIAIYPDGTAYPCCSGGFNKEANLCLGNVYQDSPEAILFKAYSNFHVRIAKELGFDKLYDFVRERKPELFGKLTPFQDVDSVCEICRNINSSIELVRELAEIYEEMEITYVLERVDSDIGMADPRPEPDGRSALRQTAI